MAKEVQTQLLRSVTDMAAEPAESHCLAGQLSCFEFRAKMGWHVFPLLFFFEIAKLGMCVMVLLVV